MSKEHSYAYAAGYRDGSINYELEHCPACKNVADLQEVLAENDKLRELVRDMWCEGMCECGSRGKCAECMYDYPTRMRELGVEVPDGEVKAIIVPGPCRILGLFGRRDDYLIPWNCIRRIGPDIVLVDIKVDECRVPRARKGFIPG